jgi:hypothetical protein
MQSIAGTIHSKAPVLRSGMETADYAFGSNPILANLGYAPIRVTRFELPEWPGQPEMSEQDNQENPEATKAEGPQMTGAA